MKFFLLGSNVPQGKRVTIVTKVFRSGLNFLARAGKWIKGSGLRDKIKVANEWCADNFIIVFSVGFLVSYILGFLFSPYR